MTISAKKLKSCLKEEHIIKILSELGSTVHKNTSEHIIFYSSCHHLDAHSHKPKLYYIKDRKLFHCFTCASTFDIISLVETRWKLEDRKDYSFTSILDYIASVANINGEHIQALPSDIQLSQQSWRVLAERYSKHERRSKALNIHPKQLLERFDSIVPLQWLNEGISLTTMQKYCIRYYGLRNQTLIPCFDAKNNLVGIRVRNWQEDENKYDVLQLLDGTSYRFQTHQVLYGYNHNQYAIEAQRKVMIVESEKAVMKSDTWYGYNSTTVGVFGQSGWNLNKARRDMILDKEPNTLIIVPDYDYKEPYTKEFFDWWDKQIVLADKFKGMCEVLIILNINGIVPYKDNAFDMSQEIFEQLLDGAAEIHTLDRLIQNERKRLNV